MENNSNKSNFLNNNMIINLLSGMLGIVLYTLFTSVIGYLKNGYDPIVMINENYKSWIATMLLLAIAVISMDTSPELSEMLKEKTGADLAKYSGNYITFGFAFTPLVKAFIKRSKNDKE